MSITNFSVENLHSQSCFGNLQSKTSSHFASPSEMLSFVLCSQEIPALPFTLFDLLSGKAMATFTPSTFLLPLHRFDISDFPQSQSSKWQRPWTEDSEQQPLSVHFWPKDHAEISLIGILTTTPSQIMACVDYDNCYKPQIRPANNHDCLLLRWKIFCHLSTNGNLGNLLFYKDVLVKTLDCSVPTPKLWSLLFCLSSSSLEIFTPCIQRSNKNTRK